MATAVVLDGNIEPLEADRTKFRDYAYLLRNDDNGKNVHVWPRNRCWARIVQTTYELY